MRLVASLVYLTACTVFFGQATQRRTSSDLQLAVSDYGTHFFYSIPDPDQVRKAWIEVLDRPVILDQTPVAIQASGTLDWEWNRSALNVYEQPDDNLVVSIWDPNGETLACDPDGVMSSQPGGVVSGATVGARQQFTPLSRLGHTWLRAPQGSGTITFEAVGIDLSPNTKFQINTSRGGRCGEQNMHAHVLDLAHARIILGSDCLKQPGLLLITTSNYTDDGATVHVASRASPKLDSVSPSSVPDDLREDQLRLLLRGRGFTKDSVVQAGYDPDGDDFQTSQLLLTTEYISSTELQVHVEPVHSKDATVAQPRGERLRLWVKGNAEKFELSRPFDVTLRPTGHPFSPDRLSDADFRRWKPKTAMITSVYPFPIWLLNEHSPEELEVSIRGENFSSQDKVAFSFGSNVNNNKEVRSEYISPTMLHAWLPRQFWRKHAICYRLVVETKEGKIYTRQVDEAYGP
jgi:hypothetical protein